MTGTGLAVARTRGALASLFAATRFSRAIRHLPVLELTPAPWPYGLPDAPKEESGRRGHPYTALSRFFSRGVELEIGLTPRRCKKKFPLGAIFFPDVSLVAGEGSHGERRASSCTQSRCARERPMEWALDASAARGRQRRWRVL